MVRGGGSAVAWNYGIVGAAVILLAFLSEMATFRPWKEGAIATLGAWLVVSPLVIDYTVSSALSWNAVVAGLLVLALAGWALGDAHEVLPKLIRPKGDLRGTMLSLALPDEHEHLVGAHVHRPDGGPDILHPGFAIQSPGQATKSSE